MLSDDDIPSHIINIILKKMNIAFFLPKVATKNLPTVNSRLLEGYLFLCSVLLVWYNVFAYVRFVTQAEMSNLIKLLLMDM